MKHFGDITKLSGYDLPPVDIVVGGSPCQDISVAGGRSGLAGERSGLFMEQIRIVKEMRKQDEYIRGTDVDIRPRFMVWGNVPGAFSSNKGGTSRPSSPRSSASQTQPLPMCLCLKRVAGQNPGCYTTIWEDGALLGDYTTHSYGESPSVERGSHLSQILEDSPLPKYYLSAKACEGILRRAETRGKPIPDHLRQALLARIG